MRLVFGLVLLVGIGLAGTAVYLAKDYVSAYQAELEAERAARAEIVPTVEVYVANRQINYGEQISAEDVRVVKWPENAIPEGAFLTAEEFFGDDPEDLRTAVRRIEKDEALLAVKMTEPGADGGVASRLTPGSRAYAIEVDVRSGVSGFLRPGDRVDVYWTGDATMANGERRGVTKLIESNINILAVDQTADADGAGTLVARTVTVEATPREIAALAQAQSTGNLSLALVGVQDDTIVADNIEIDQKQLLGIEDEPEPEVEEVVEAAPPRVCTIRTRRGAEVVDIPIPCTN